MSQEFNSAIPTSITNIFEDNKASRVNENTLRSNFSGSTPPENPVFGQKWVDSASKVEYIFTGVGTYSGGWEEVGARNSAAKDVLASKGSLDSLEDRLNVSLKPDGTLKVPAEYNASEWVEAHVLPTFITAEQFSIADDYTSIYAVNRFLKFTTPSKVYYAYITAVSYSSGTDLTTVTLDSAVLTNDVTKMEYSLCLETTQELIALIKKCTTTMSPIVQQAIYG